ncbi:MAG: TonB-dependent receptor [Sphingomonas bacterium]
MHLTNRRFAIAALLASASFASPAFAQSTPPADTQEATPGSDRDDIVVTAQKREESMQDVPISIQAIGTKKLDQLNITNFAEYAQLLPSVSFQALGGTPGTNVVYMRGVASGGDGNHSGSLPSVGVYLDEQPVTTIGGNLDVHVYDIARIESLAGPQGTLYGASSEAGTIRIITNKPDTSGFYGRIDGEVNTVNKGGVGGKLEGMINMPFSQDIALRVVGFYQKDAGFIDNVAGTRTFLPDPGGNSITVNNNAFVKKDYNDTEIWGGRAALKIDLDDNWTVTPAVIYQDERSHGSYGYDPKVGDLQVQHFFPEYRRDRFIQAALTIEGKLGNWDLTYAGAYLDRKDLSSSDYTDYAEAYDSLYSSVGGIAGYAYFGFVNAAGAHIDPRQKVIGTDHFKKMSQEFRVASPQDERFRIVAGVFYQNQSNDIHQDYQVAGLAPAMSVNGLPGTLWLTQQHRVDKDYAMFGEASFDILPNLTLTGGGRAFIYDNSLIGFFGFGRNPLFDPNDFTNPLPNAAGSSRTGVAGCYTTTGVQLRDNPGGTLLPAAVAGSPCTNLGTIFNGQVIPKETQGQGLTHKLNLTWKPVKDVLFYGTWSRGFRPGGINRRGTLPPYAADYLTNYEIGWKTTLLDGKLRFNGAVYQQEWSKFQFSFLGQNSFTEIHNGPDARIRGVEMDANLNLGHLVLTAAGSYTDAKTKRNLCAFDDPTYTCVPAGGGAAQISAPAGTRLPITPRFKGNATARYTFNLGDLKPYLQAVVAHQSSASSDIRVASAADLGRIQGYTTADFSGGIEFDKYTFELYIANAFDERAQLSRFEECGACSQRPYIVPNMPRTIGVRAGAKF